MRREYRVLFNFEHKTLEGTMNHRPASCETLNISWTTEGGQKITLGFRVTKLLPFKPVRDENGNPAGGYHQVNLEKLRDGHPLMGVKAIETTLLQPDRALQPAS